MAIGFFFFPLRVGKESGETPLPRRPPLTTPPPPPISLLLLRPASLSRTHTPRDQTKQRFVTSSRRPLFRHSTAHGPPLARAPRHVGPKGAHAEEGEREKGRRQSRARERSTRCVIVRQWWIETCDEAVLRRGSDLERTSKGQVNQSIACQDRAQARRRGCNTSGRSALRDVVCVKLRQECACWHRRRHF